MSSTTDVLILGAGVSGLAAGIDLANAGLKVSILEARDRVGGRIFTEHDPSTKTSFELGAEFIHGRAPEILQPLKKNHVRITEFDGDNWCFRDGELCPCDFFSEVEKILKKMKRSPRDQSFQRFLQREFPKCDPKLEENMLWARRYVTGFNAADPADVSVNWLVQQQHAEEKIGADRAFFINRGYSALVETFMERLEKLKVSIHLSCVARDIRWSRGRVEVTGNAKQKNFRFGAARVLITVPLGVLLAKRREEGAIRFNPRLPSAKHEAFKKLAMGHALRVTLHFKERFWKDIRPATNKSKTLSNLSFLFSEEEWFSTWWTKSPAKLPVITGWAAFQSAESLSGRGRKFVINKALTTLSRLLQTPKKDLISLLASAHFHDWQSDPFSRGAYSYVKVGGLRAPEILASPVQRTLFFAGEATDSSQIGTVHGAIASGKRAALEIIKLA